MTKDLEKKIQIFFGLHEAWKYLDKALNKVDNLPDDSKDPDDLDELWSSETFKTYEKIDDALNKCDAILSNYYNEICSAFEKMSTSELEEFGMTYWNETVGDILFTLLTGGDIPQNYDDRLEYFKSKTAIVC